MTANFQVPDLTVSKWVKGIMMDKFNKWFAETLRKELNAGLFNIKDTFAESSQLQMSVLPQSMCIFKAGLSSQVHMMAGQNVTKST